jgi:hypothetical protein
MWIRWVEQELELVQVWVRLRETAVHAGSVKYPATRVQPHSGGGFKV